LDGSEHAYPIAISAKGGYLVAGAQIVGTDLQPSRHVRPRMFMSVVFVGATRASDWAGMPCIPGELLSG
jgi:hypothetical protein